MDKDVINIEQDELLRIVRRTVAQGETVRITVVGNSMYPFLRNGIDSVELSAPDNIKRNDVLFYTRDNGKCILHRCIAVRDDEYIMCGDNQTEKEYGVKQENIAAAARVFYRGNKTITPSTPWYRVYMFLWCTLFALRPFMCVILKGVMKIKRIFKRSR